MTDTETKKALECCIKHTECPKCPMRGTRDCMSKLNKNAFDLINRQKAEIERLMIENQESDILINMQDKNMQQQQAIINTLQTLNKIERKQARKEIIEKIKSKFSHKGNSTKYGEFTWDDITSYELDNLLKEMEGETGIRYDDGSWYDTRAKKSVRG